MNPAKISTHTVPFGLCVMFCVVASDGASNKAHGLSSECYSFRGHDSLKEHNDMQFTTRDRDNDVYNHNCAVLYTGAWWYSMCQHSNLNGNYSTISYGKGLRWYMYNYPSSDYMKETTMKLKCG
ncbi:hypothetical protein FSP39_013429 [Pinctada imbricata]|uniref:Fibrinogen C-terminal domain-containing protein n=1 Tax=Pinctada imbricata TaxID=66713 RepID=A0AA89C1N7_PINIB|nr:hypothetical protein FSP39_013429 [Pinctada imbricata]